MINSSNIKLTAKETFNAGRKNLVHPFKESNIDYYYGPYTADSTTITYKDNTDTTQTIDLTNETSLKKVIGAKIYDNIMNYLLISGIAIDETLVRNYFFAYCYLFIVNDLCDIGRTVGILDNTGNCAEFCITFNESINSDSKLLYFTKKFNSYTDEYFNEYIKNNLKIINYNTNCGSYLPSQLALYGSIITVPNCTRTSYDLVTISDGTNQYQVGEEVIIKDDMTFTYNWKSATEYVKLSIKTEFGSVKVVLNNEVQQGVVSGFIYSYNIPKNSKVTLTADPQAGYKFTNFNNITYSNPYTITITSNTEITVNYTAILDDIDIYYVDADYVEVDADPDYQIYCEKITTAIKQLPTITEPISAKVISTSGIIYFNNKNNKCISKSLYLILPTYYNINSMQYYDDMKDAWIDLLKDIFIEHVAAEKEEYNVWLIHKLDNSSIGGADYVRVSVEKA
jgi:hypothetical protein